MLYSKIKCTVVGDVGIDYFVYSRVIKVSAEAPILVVRKQAVCCVLGLAANVASNVKALGANVQIVGVQGSDYFGQKMLNLIGEQNIQNGLVGDKRPTTVKERILANSQQIVRLDTEVDVRITSQIRNSLLDKIREFNPDIILVSDYLKGVVSFELLEELRNMGKMIISNPKPKNILAFRDTDTISLNKEEAYRALKYLKNSKLGLEDLRKLLNIKYLIETRGQDGLIIYGEDGRISNPAEMVNVADVTGAGDTVIAIVALERFLGTSIQKIGMLANFGGASVVKQRGTHTVDREEFFRFRKTVLGVL